MEDLSAVGSADTVETRRPPHNLFTTLMISIFSCLFAIGCCYFALFSVSFRRGLITSTTKIALLRSECLSPVPSKYSVPSYFLVPFKYESVDNFSKWCRPIVYFFEAMYRGQGYLSEYMEENEFVKFSEHNFAMVFSSYLGMSIDSITKNLGNVNESNVVIGSPESIVLFLDDEKSSSSLFVPNGFVPSSSAQGFIQFSIGGIKRVNWAESIKKTLIASMHPLLVSLRLPKRKLYLNDAEFELPLKSSIIIEDTSIGNQTVKDPVIMAIVGYNDNFIYAVNSSYFFKGGFVLRSGYLDNEHSREFFMNEITSIQENMLCVDDSDISNWNTTTLECIKSNLNASKCNSTELKCVDERVCNTNLKYVYTGSNNTFIEWSNSLEPHIVQIDFPSEYLYSVIRPLNLSEKSPFCTYSFIPYEVVKNILSMEFGTFLFDTIDINVRWTEASFFDKNKKLNAIKEATFTDPSLTIGLPYDKVQEEL